MNITNKDFEKLIIEAKRKKKKTTINLGGNLFAIVRPRSDKISFTIRVRTKSKDTMRTIGSFPNITLSYAREKALIEQKLIKKELEVEDLKNIAPILRDAFDEWYTVKVKQYKVGSTRPKNLMTIMRTTIEPSGLADLPITEINPRTISAKLADLDQTAGNKHNAVSTISSCLQFYYLKGMLPFNPIADLLKGRESPFKKPKTNGFKFIAPDELSEKFLKPLSSTAHVNRIFYLYLLLTGFRFGEARLAHWSWFDFKRDLIVIPADAIGANKTQTEYVKPMTKQINLLILNWKDFNYSDDSDFVFKSEYTKKLYVKELLESL